MLSVNFVLAGNTVVPALHIPVASVAGLMTPVIRTHVLLHFFFIPRAPPVQVRSLSSLAGEHSWSQGVLVEHLHVLLGVEVDPEVLGFAVVGSELVASCVFIVVR